jgi:hypothetical protein
LLSLFVLEVTVPPASALEEWEEVTLHDLSKPKRRKKMDSNEQEEVDYSAVNKNPAD